MLPFMGHKELDTTQQLNNNAVPDGAFSLHRTNGILDTNISVGTVIM